MKRAWQLAVVALVLAATQARAIDKINLLLGEQKTIEVQDVARVAVGDGTILNVRVVSPNELLLSGLAAGITTMTIWNDAGQKETINVQVYTQNPEEVRRDVESLLVVPGGPIEGGTPIEGVRVRVVGDRVVIEGETLKDDDAQRVDAVSKLFPGVVNLTTFNRTYNLIKPMVRLDLQFYEMRRDDIAEIGINWADIVDPVSNDLVEFDYSRVVGDRPITGQLPGPPPVLLEQADTGTIRIFNTFNPVRLRGDYQAARLLQHHKMVVRNAEKAHYLEGGTVYIIAEGGAGGAGQILEVEFGFVVDVTPEVDKAGNVVMAIEQTFSIPDRAQLIAGFPTFEERSINTTVNLALGQTVMLSGFLTESLAARSLGIPGFAKLPVLGALFGSKGSATQQTDGVLFVTPTLVQGVGNPGEDPFIRGIVDRYRAGGSRPSVGEAE